MIRTLLKFFCVATLLAGASNASTITWDIQGLSVAGGPVTGSFVYDFTSGSVTSVNVIAPQIYYGGTSFHFDYGSTTSVLNFVTSADFANSGGALLTINLATPLTVSGGVVNITSTELGDYESAGTQDVTADSTGGTVEAESSTPEPASMVLLLGGLATFGFAARRRSAIRRS